MSRKNNHNLDQLIKEAEREIAKQKAYLKELKSLKQATQAMQFKNIRSNLTPGQAFSTKQVKWKEYAAPQRQTRGKQPQQKAINFEQRLQEETRKIEDRVRSQLEAEYSKKFQKAVKKLRTAGKKKGIRYIRIKDVNRPRGPNYMTDPAGRKYPNYKNLGYSPSVRPLREKFTEAQKAAARQYHYDEAKKHGFRYKPITEEAKERAQIVFKQKQAVADVARVRGISLDNVVYQKGAAYSSKTMIKHMAKFRSFLHNPNTKEKLRGDVWNKVLRGEIAIGSQALENALRETRDLVDDHYGIDTP